MKTNFHMTPSQLCVVKSVFSVSCHTWPTISGIPRALSISCRVITSALLSRESSWSRRARSSPGPSLLGRGPRSSSSGCGNCSLIQTKTQTVSDFFSQTEPHGYRFFQDTWSHIHLFVLVCGRSIPMAESGQEGDWGGGLWPPKGLMLTLDSLAPTGTFVKTIWSVTILLNDIPVKSQKKNWIYIRSKTKTMDVLALESRRTLTNLPKPFDEP